MGPRGHEGRQYATRPLLAPVSPACGPGEHVAPPNVTSGDGGGERERRGGGRGGSGHFARSDWLGGSARPCCMAVKTLGKFLELRWLGWRLAGHQDTHGLIELWCWASDSSARLLFRPVFDV